ncbi:MAG: NRDE family protein [Burkholderiaceae bacterium]
MCIVYLAINAHDDWPLFIAANRDEFHNRASLPAAPWPDHPDVIAGVDCQAHGTWLGVTRQGRYAFLTNYRDPGRNIAQAPSRGALVSHFLTGRQPTASYAQSVQGSKDAYNGFNLVVGDLSGACYIGNRTPQTKPQTLRSGERHVLSNHLLDTPWPKAERLRLALDLFSLERLNDTLTPVFEMLKDSTQAEDTVLPSTGIPLARERLLSSPFVISLDYGTRCSTIVAVHASGRAIFSETSYDFAGDITERHDWPFLIEK